jgi:hypothetical protein
LESKLAENIANFYTNKVVAVITRVQALKHSIASQDSPNTDEEVSTAELDGLVAEIINKLHVSHASSTPTVIEIKETAKEILKASHAPHAPHAPLTEKEEDVEATKLITIVEEILVALDEPNTTSKEQTIQNISRFLIDMYYDKTTYRYPFQGYSSLQEYYIDNPLSCPIDIFGILVIATKPQEQQQEGGQVRKINPKSTRSHSMLFSNTLNRIKRRFLSLVYKKR